MSDTEVSASVRDDEDAPGPAPEEKRSRRKSRRKSKENVEGPDETSTRKHRKKSKEKATDSGDSSKKSKRGSRANLLDEENQEVNSKLAEREEKKKSKKKSRKKSKKSEKPSLEDSIRDPALALALSGLQDDMHSLDEMDALSVHSRMPSPVNLPPSTPVDRVFTEKQGGKFKNTSRQKLASINPSSLAAGYLDAAGNTLYKPRQTPIEWGMETQKLFRSLGIFSHGFLAGIAFWQVLTVFVLNNGVKDPLEFVSLYSPLAQQVNFLFYFLTVVCTISILDRYDIANMSWPRIQKMLTFRSGGIAILVYTTTLILTLTTTKLDDKLSLYQTNVTLFESLEPEELEGELYSWRALNLCRAVGVILGWILVALRPNTDLLLKHLHEISTEKVRYHNSLTSISEKVATEVETS